MNNTFNIGAMDTVLSLIHIYQPLYNIYVAIGQKRANISRLVAKLEETGAMKYYSMAAGSEAEACLLYTSCDYHENKNYQCEHAANVMVFKYTIILST